MSLKYKTTFNLLEWSVESGETSQRESLATHLIQQISTQGLVGAFIKVPAIDFLQPAILMDLAWVSVKIESAGYRSFVLVDDSTQTDCLQTLGIDRWLNCRKSLKLILTEVTAKLPQALAELEFQELRDSFSAFCQDQFGVAPILHHPKAIKSLTPFNKLQMGVEIFWANAETQYFFCLSSSDPEMEALASKCGEVKGAEGSTDFWAEFGSRIIRRFSKDSAVDPAGNLDISFQLVKVYHTQVPVQMQLKHWTGESFEMTISGHKFLASLLVQPRSLLRAIKTAA